MHVEQEDYFSAEAAYETSISLADKRPSLRLWFAGFLSRKLGDQDRALAQLLTAEALAPASALVKLETARVLQYQRKFEEAAIRLDSLADIERLSARTRRMHLDLSLQNFLRKSEHCGSMHQYREALECLEAAKALLENAPSSLIDPETTRHVFHSAIHFPTLLRAFEGLPDEGRLKSVVDWLSNSKVWGIPNAAGVSAVSSLEIPEQEIGLSSRTDLPPNRGKLVHKNPTFAFIETGGARFFFHQNSWRGEQSFGSAKEGDIVDFELGKNAKGVCAIDVRPMSDSATSKVSAEPSTERVLGAVLSLFPKHGFIELDGGGGSVFFHRDTCTAATKFKSLAVGDRVRLTITRNLEGKRRAVDVELYSGR